jgi:hypothetical protein
MDGTKRENHKKGKSHTRLIIQKIIEDASRCDMKMKITIINPALDSLRLEA